MTEEALTAAQKQAKLIAQHHFCMRIGRLTGIGMGIGVAGMMGSVIMYSTALVPFADKGELKGFRQATAGMLSTVEDGDTTQLRVAAVAAAGVAAVGSARSAARRAA